MSGKSIPYPTRPLNDEVLALDVTERGKPCPKRVEARGLRRKGAQTQIPDSIQLVRLLLRPRGKRPRRRAAEKPDKFPPPHQHHPQPERAISPPRLLAQPAVRCI